MRLGLIVRADDRGLGIQTQEIYRHLRPAVTVCVDISPFDPRGLWPQRFDRFSDAVISPWAGYLNPLSPEAVEALLTCDVVFSVETTYDPELFARARERGIKTIIYINPELWRPHETEHASEVWYPTEWRVDQLPPGEVVAMPVATDRFGGVRGEGWLHVGGHRAAGDRDGTTVAIRAARAVGARLTVTSQDRMGANRYLDLRGALENYWELYGGMGLLILPRRYGGLSLKAQEAMAAGLAVVMTDTPPNRRWPIVPVRATRGRAISLPGGRIETVNPDLNDLVMVLRRLRASPDELAEHQARSRVWAAENSWDALGDAWRVLLAR